MKKTIIALVALPRSGTTLTAAIFDVHPDVASWFEPWHARQKIDPKPLMSLADLQNQYKNIFGIDVSNESHLVLKETTSNIHAIEWLTKSLENISKSDDVNVKVVWLLRNINHAYLSRIDGARKWWGHEDMQVNEETYHQFIRFAFKGFIALDKLVKQYDSILLSYESMLKDLPGILEPVMKFMNTNLDDRQLEYHKYFVKEKSAGDQNVSKNPQPPSYDAVRKKNDEWEESAHLIDTLKGKLLKKYLYMNNLFIHSSESGVMTKEQYINFTSNLECPSV